MRRHVVVRRVVLLTATALAGALPVATAYADPPPPGEPVASVGGVAITDAAFAHWMTVAAASQQRGSGATQQVPVPPDFTACIAANQAAARKGEKQRSEAQLKAQCRRQYGELRDQVMQFLLSAQWILGEAAIRGIAVTDEQVQAELDKQRKASYPKQRDFERFLKDSGMTMDDLRFRVRVDTLSERLRKQVTQGAVTTPTSAQIAAYYAKHKRQFRTKARQRTLKQATKEIVRILTEKQEGKALNAFVRAFEAGWKAKTECRTGYVVEQCANAPTGPPPTG